MFTATDRPSFQCPVVDRAPINVVIPANVKHSDAKLKDKRLTVPGCCPQHRSAVP
jgi:hypothetical protein